MPTAKKIKATAIKKAKPASKSTKRAVKKIGGRVLGGVGLALMILDFTYCVATIQDA